MLWSREGGESALHAGRARAESDARFTGGGGRGRVCGCYGGSMELRRCGVLQASALFCFVLMASWSAGAVKITKLTVPKVVESGKSGSYDLDCQFRCNESDAKLVVKWYFNREPEPFYQWIAEREDPVIQDRFQDHLKTERALEGNEGCDILAWQLRIERPTVNMTGNYRCHVSSFEGGEDTFEASMVVFVRPSVLRFNYTKWSPDKATLSCDVTETFPQPTLKLYRISAKTEIEVEDVVVDTDKQDGLFNVSLSSEVLDSSLPQDEETVFVCRLSYKDVMHPRSERITYVPGLVKVTESDQRASGSQISPFWWLIISIIILRLS
ncbi:uncharacterized protein LOC135385968 isoform X2 [Ornithodoros turicata]|uniref:uncharacterized protein LOC135385968 isoform X2 n=1 Tax=Ornithodoros turicata TaxID=34597 RepID=UPI0031388247